MKSIGNIHDAMSFALLRLCGVDMTLKGFSAWFFSPTQLGRIDTKAGKV
jgi:hypothetical protein